MDVEATIKLNEMAKNLVQRGFAASSEDAYEMAQRMVKPVLPQSQKTEKPETTEKYKIAIERLTRKFDNEVNSLKEHIHSLIREVNYLKESVVKNRENIKTLKTPAEEPVAIKKQDTPQTELKQEKREVSQRSGAFKPGDKQVSVENVFYCGQKQ